MSGDREAEGPGRDPRAGSDTLPSQPGEQTAPARTAPTPSPSDRSLIEGADTLGAEDGGAAPPPPEDDLLGGRYQILGELGRGGEGVVYRARDVRADTVVALKMLEREHTESRRRLLRFRRELQMARKVTHPGVVRIHDLVELPGRFGLSMELVEGEALDYRLSRGTRWEPEAIVKLADDLAHALAAAHAAGVTHRDLKPPT